MERNHINLVGYSFVKNKQTNKTTSTGKDQLHIHELLLLGTQEEASSGTNVKSKGREPDAAVTHQSCAGRAACWRTRPAVWAATGSADGAACRTRPPGSAPSCSSTRLARVEHRVSGM